MNVRPRRSVLYMPGANERALEKAKTLPADSLILDLEDSVAPEAKGAARDNVCAAVKAGGYGRRELVIRVNAVETAWGMDDLRAAASVAPDAILVPKVSNAGDIVTVAKVLDAIAAPDKTRVWAMMETPSSVLNARFIAALGADKETRLVCLVMGTNDLLKESRARALHNRIAVVPWTARRSFIPRRWRRATRCFRPRTRRCPGRARSSPPSRIR
jgi:citrate lyase subunit beta/citryl-CoA lyase